MNRQHRRAAAKRGRSTPKKERGPVLVATVTDAEGNEKKILMRGEPVTEDQMREAEAQKAVLERSRQLADERKEAEMRLQAHVHGLWLPGDS
jgi:hypothetical protein